MEIDTEPPLVVTVGKFQQPVKSCALAVEVACGGGGGGEFSTENPNKVAFITFDQLPSTRSRVDICADASQSATLFSAFRHYISSIMIGHHLPLALVVHALLACSAQAAVTLTTNGMHRLCGVWISCVAHGVRLSLGEKSPAQPPGKQVSLLCTYFRKPGCCRDVYISCSGACSLALPRLGDVAPSKVIVPSVSQTRAVTPDVIHRVAECTAFERAVRRQALAVVSRRCRRLRLYSRTSRRCWGRR